MKHNRIMTQLPEKAEEVTINAITDLNETFDEIKASPLFAQFTKDSEVICQMFFNIVVAFSIGQVLEMAKKAHMTHDKTKTVLTPEERFVVLMNEIMAQFHRVGTATAKRKLP